MSTHSDLVSRIRSGDQKAFRELMNTYYNGLVRFGASLVGSQDSAEDLVQGVFFKVWEGRSRLDPDKSIRTYLFTSLRNRALDLYKHERAQGRFSEEVGYLNETALSPYDEMDAVSAFASEEARLEALTQAIKQLPERSRTALSLRFDQGMTHAEIGSVLGVSDKAAQQVVLRAISALKGLM